MVPIQRRDSCKSKLLRSELIRLDRVERQELIFSETRKTWHVGFEDCFGESFGI